MMMACSPLGKKLLKLLSICSKHPSIAPPTIIARVFRLTTSQSVYAHQCCSLTNWTAKNGEKLGWSRIVSVDLCPNPLVEVSFKSIGMIVASLYQVSGKNKHRMLWDLCYSCWTAHCVISKSKSGLAAPFQDGRYDYFKCSWTFSVNTDGPFGCHVCIGWHNQFHTRVCLPTRLRSLAAPHVSSPGPYS